MFVGFLPSLPVLPANSCIRDGKYFPNSEPHEANSNPYVQGTQNPEPILTQRVTTRPASSASPVADQYTPSTTANDIMNVAKRHCAFTHIDHSIATIDTVAALSGAAGEIIFSGDKDGIEVEGRGEYVAGRRPMKPLVQLTAITVSFFPSYLIYPLPLGTLFIQKKCRQSSKKLRRVLFFNNCGFSDPLDKCEAVLCSTRSRNHSYTEEAASCIAFGRYVSSFKYSIR